ncbi:murein L,D-transpeptidase catalytic domain family protein [Polymorphobacter sp.]|uniref:murein L,D-transpeptidase catalytic domain family protein n=1 Tax=Polymorphobacter sp. TaxID=1909290 RepID=UPI003F72C9AA
MNRRLFLGGLAALAAPPARLLAATPEAINPALRDRALAALARHRTQIVHADVIGIVDYARPSRQPRFHLLDLVSGQTETLLVAHGKGSDPAHSGWLERFSNTSGSNASSDGAFLTANAYIGRHGRSMRLKGLEPCNDAALARAIVVHSADYVTADRAAAGKLGRSLGCFTVTAQDLPKVLTRLGAGRLLYSDKV